MTEDRDGWRVSDEKGFYAIDPATKATTTVEEWLEKKDVANASGTEIAEESPKAVDGDNDGLSDKDEFLLGTSASTTDSDQDGYLDMDEIGKGYNPAGAGELAKNQGLKYYANNGLKFSTLIPAAWIIEEHANMIVFRSPDSEFFQVLLDANSPGRTLEAWVSEQAKLELKPEDIEEHASSGGKPAWRGASAPDGLSAYIMSSDSSKVAVLSYSSGAGNIREYPGLFKIFKSNFNFLDNGAAN
jgi:hypothetical protein